MAKIQGNTGDNRLIGEDDDDDNIFGRSGDDTLIGLRGDDKLFGGAGDDSLHGGSGSDKLIGEGGSDTLIGGSGDDIIEGGLGDDFLSGGSGFDTISYANSKTAIQTFTGSSAQREYTVIENGVDYISGIEKIIGSKYEDIFRLDSVPINIDCGLGNDRLVFDGPLSVIDYKGTSEYIGGAGIDILEMKLLRNVNIDLRDHEEQEILEGFFAKVDVENVIVATGTIIGNQKNNILTANSGGTLSGAGGNDILIVKLGNSRLQGGAGDDQFFTDSVRDVMTGGAGNDRFVMTDTSAFTGQVDLITDFSEGDVVDVSRIDADPFESGVQSFIGFGSSGLRKISSYYDLNSDTTNISLNVYGYDVRILQLEGRIELDTNDFAL